MSGGQHLRKHAPGLQVTCEYCGEPFRRRTSQRHCSDFCRFWSKVDYRGDCWEWTGSLDSKGYGQIGIAGKLVLCPRFVCDPAPGMCALHHCDNPKCVRPGHLWEGTRGDNNADRRAKGREPDRRGRRNGRAKLTEAEVLAIRTAPGSFKKLGDTFGVTHTTVRGIKTGRIWRHL